jgi:hypothetical protein
MYLKTEEGIEHNTAMRYIKNLKKIINLAANHKWMSHWSQIGNKGAFSVSFRKTTFSIDKFIGISSVLSFIPENRIFTVNVDLWLISLFTAISPR